jgi:hypothetical protein
MKLMQYKWLLAPAVALSAIIASSCGGASVGGNGGNGGNGGTGGITDAGRVAVGQAVSSHLASIDRNSPAGRQQLVNFLQARGEISTAGASADGTVWGKFSDGVLLVIPPHTPPANRSRVIDDLELPKDDQAGLYSALGSYHRSALHTFIEPDLNNHYLYADFPGSIASLKGIQPGWGFLIFETHGGIGADDTYSMWTSTEATAEAIAANKDDLLAGNIVLMITEHDADDAGQPTRPMHLGITPGFVKKYMAFSPHALAIIAAANSNHATLRSAFGDVGLSVFGGFTGDPGQVVDDLIAVVVHYFLGDTFEVGGRKLRPFDWETIQRRLNETGVSTVGAATFSFTHLNGAFGLLAPALHRMHIDEDNAELVLMGEFGTARTNRSVTINGAAVTVKSWTPTEIVVALPANAHGDVQVRNGLSKSNTRRITMWEGLATYTLTSAGNLQAKMNLPMKFRADVGPIRRDIDTAPEKQILMLLIPPTNLPTATFNMQGQYTYTDQGCTFTYKWAGSGQLPHANEPNIEHHYGLMGLLDPQLGSMGLQIGASTKINAWTWTRETVCNEQMDTDISHTGFSVHPEIYDSPNTLQTTIGNDYVIKGGTRTKQVFFLVGNVTTATVTFQWPDMTPTSPPRADSSL